jgi:hypothetical protein
LRDQGLAGGQKIHPGISTLSYSGRRFPHCQEGGKSQDFRLFGNGGRGKD